VLGAGSVLSLRLDGERPPAAGSTVRVIDAPALRGRFGRVELSAGSDRLRAVPVYTADGLSVRVERR
ncbi:phosphoesterase, partial [Streptomyces sp. NPDC057052]